MSDEVEFHPDEPKEITELATHTFPISVRMLQQVLNMPRSMEITEIRPPVKGEGVDIFGGDFPPEIVMMTVTGPGVPHDLAPDAIPNVTHHPEHYNWEWQ